MQGLAVRGYSQAMNEAGATTTPVTVAEAAERVADGAALIDVRTDMEWDASRIPGAKHVPLDQLAAHAGELDPEDELIIYCRTDNRSQMAAEALAGAGYNARFLAGGIKAWAESGHEVDPADGEIA